MTPLVQTWLASAEVPENILEGQILTEGNSCFWSRHAVWGKVLAMDRVKGKVVIVTGAALGIGRATSILLAQEGAEIAVTDLLDSQGKALNEIAHAGRSAEYWHLDVACSIHPGYVWTPLVEALGRESPGGVEGFSTPSRQPSSHRSGSRAGGYGLGCRLPGLG